VGIEVQTNLIIAKGMLRNVNTYTREDQTYYYPNYPYNDLTADPFLNTTNNAFSQLCDGYNVNITKLQLDPNGGASYADVIYTDCNTNKQTTKKYTALGTYQLCSIGKPLIVGPAEAEIGLSTYDVWSIEVCFCGEIRRGARVQYEDVVRGIVTEWVDGWPWCNRYGSECSARNYTC
jgi:hypothetical protein